MLSSDLGGWQGEAVKLGDAAHSDTPENHWEKWFILFTFKISNVN